MKSNNNINPISNSNSINNNKNKILSIANDLIKKPLNFTKRLSNKLINNNSNVLSNQSNSSSNGHLSTNLTNVSINDLLNNNKDMKDYISSENIIILQKTESLIHDINIYLGNKQFQSQSLEKSLDRSVEKINDKTLDKSINKVKNIMKKLTNLQNMNSPTNNSNSQLITQSNTPDNTSDQLLHQISEYETSLSNIQYIYSQSKESLLTQSDYIRSRLVSCLKYNKFMYISIKKSMEESKILYDYFNKSVKQMKDMIIFFDEINIQKHHQDSVYIPWALRRQQSLNKLSTLASNNNAAVITPVTKEDLIKRMKKLLKARKYASQCFEFHHKEYEHVSMLLRKSEFELVNYNSVLEKIGVNSKLPTYFPNADDEVDDELDEELDEDFDLETDGNKIKIKDIQTDGRIDKHKKNSNEYIDIDISDNEFEDIVDDKTDNKNESIDPDSKITITRNPLFSQVPSSSSFFIQSDSKINSELDNNLNSELSNKTDESINVGLDIKPKKYVTYGSLLVESYDHSQCADCSLVYVMAVDSYMYLRAVHSQSLLAARLVQKLDRYKQQLLELEK